MIHVMPPSRKFSPAKSNSKFGSDQNMGWRDAVATELRRSADWPKARACYPAAARGDNASQRLLQEMAMTPDPVADARLSGKKSLRLLFILLAVTLGVTFFGELAVMIVVPYLLPADASKWAVALFDAALLSAVVTAVVLPLMLYYRQRNLRVVRRALRLQFTLDQHAIVSMTDPAGCITFANDRFCAISGYTRQELIGQNHRLLKSNEHPPEFYADMWRTLTLGRTWHGDVCNRVKTGGHYWVHATIAPFLNERGKPDEFIAIRTDITAQKVLEKSASPAVPAATRNHRRAHAESGWSATYKEPASD